MTPRRPARNDLPTFDDAFSDQAPPEHGYDWLSRPVLRVRLRS